MPLLNLPVIVFFCHCSAKWLMTIYTPFITVGTKNIYFFAFQATPKSSSSVQSSKQRWFNRKFGESGALLKRRTCLASRRPCKNGPNELALTREVDNTLQPSLWNEPKQSASQTTEFSVSYSPLSSSGGVRSCATDPLTQNTTRPICCNRAHRNIFAVYAVDWETLSGTATTLVPRSP